MKLCCLVAVALLVLALCSQGESNNADGPKECCFTYYSKFIPPRAIKAYKMTHPKCPKRGVILMTVKDKELCANPDIKPIQDIMDRVDDLFPTISP